jgi:hypothetical protein
LAKARRAGQAGELGRGLARPSFAAPPEGRLDPPSFSEYGSISDWRLRAVRAPLQLSEDGRRTQGAEPYAACPKGLP